MIKATTFPDSLLPQAHEALVLAWRRARLSRLTAADGWLSLAGRVWLHEGDNSLGTDDDADVKLPQGKADAHLGVLRVRDSAVSFVPAQGAQVAVRRAGNAYQSAVHEPVLLTTDAHAAPDRLIVGSLTLEVMQRAGELAVRIRDAQSATRVGFPGLDYYPISTRFRIVAQLQRYEPVKALELAYESGRVEPYVSPGAAVFELDGVEHRLDPVIDGNGERLFVLFWDLTSRDQSYGAGRFLYAPMPQDGRVLLDFNQAFNPPCAFTPYAFCPLTPPQNRLALRIEAGEKRPLDPPVQVL
ncbi:MAG TPA: DUF1684 domain-containing protein [Polyangiales bacterium]